MLRLRFSSLGLALILMVLGAAIPAMSGTASASSWWNSAWSRRAPVVITETSGSALTDYQVKVVVTYDSDMKPDFSDVRFADDTGANQLSYWLESKTDGSSATFWVKVPSIPALGTTTIEMYYGNPSASTTSDIHSTFIWGDDFENAAWTDNNINRWNGQGGDSSQGVVNGEYHLQGSYIKPTNPSEGNASLSEPIAEIGPGGQGSGEANQLTPFPPNYVVEANVKTLTDNTGGVKTGGAYICPRYKNVSWKYEFVLDFQYNAAVLNWVKGDKWGNFGATWIPSLIPGYDSGVDTWSKLKAEINQDVTGDRLQVFVNDVQIIQATANYLPYPSYNGLAFKGYDWNEAFHIAFDNFRVRQYASSEPTVSICAEEYPGDTFNQLPNRPTNASPSNGATGVSLTPTLTSSAFSGSNVTLKWADKSNNEEGFYIERATKTPSGYTTYVRVGQVGANTTTYKESVATGSYKYRVQAFNLTTGRVSAHSKEAVVRVR